MSDTQGRKETGGPAIQCPMLTATNYTVWAMRMRVLMKVQDVWDTIDPGSTDVKKNNIAIALLFQSIPESLILQVGEQETSKGIWDAIKTRNVGADRVKEARLQTLMADFDRMKMADTDTIDDFVGKLSSLASRSASLGQTIEESKLVKKFLKSLPSKKFIHIIASLEQVLDLNTIAFEDIVGRLKAYEERICGEVKEEDQEKLLYSQNTQHSSSNNKAKGKEGRDGKGKEKNGSSNRNDGKRKKDRSKVICYRCEKAGHFASSCPEKLKKHEEANVAETQAADVPLFMHEIVFLNEEKVNPSRLQAEDNIWYLDNGASNHMTGNRSYFTELNEKITGKVRFGDGSCVEITGKGSILFQGKNGDQRLMTEIYLIPELKTNILSLGQATESGCEVTMKDEYLTMHDGDGRLLVKVRRSANRLYKVALDIGRPVCLSVKGNDEAWKWHARLGHIGFNKLKTMKNMVFGLPSIETTDQVCESCLVGKQTRRAFPRATSYRASQSLELVHGDLCGPISPSTIAQNRYIFVLIDDHSRYMWSILMKEKSDALDKFKRFKMLVESECGKRIKTLRTDRGGEFMSIEFKEFCESMGILRHLTAPYTPQQNGVVERRNRTLLEMTRSIMKSMKVPNYLWGEAVRHATYLINRIPTKALINITPYESLRGRKPSIEHIRVFGCVSYAKVESPHLKKLDDRSRVLVHLGIEPGSKAYRLFDPSTRKVVVSRDVVFDETLGWQWKNQVREEVGEPGMFQFEWRGSVDMGVGPVEIEANEGHDDHVFGGPEYDGQEHDGPNHEGPGYDGPEGPGFDGQDHEGPGYEGQDHDGPEHEGPEYDGPQLRRSTRHVNQPQWLKDFVLFAEEESERLLLMINGEPETYLEAEVSQEWIDAMKAEIESINKNDTWVLVDKPKDCKPIGLKWVYRIKRNADASINKHKARLVAKGYVQILGVDYEDGFAPVARIETIRLLVALAATNGWVIHHLDVKTAFLHGELKEIVYVVQPEGFIKQGEENKVYKLSKALYGLRQAPRAWNTKLDQVLKSLRFHRCTKEQSVYWFEEKGERLLVAVYVDDLFVTGSSIKLIDRFKAKMSDTFEMTDLGKLTYYLGLEVIQNSSGISIYQEGYADKILKDTNMESCNLTHIPMESGLKLSKAEGEEEIDATRYRRTIGCLRYLLHTRPDLSYSVGVLSRYMQNPKKSHGQAIKQVLRYLKGTKRQGLVFGRKGNKEIVGYSDSSHNIDPDDGRSTSGHIFYLGTSAITWCSQKQPTVALSSCEAEFMAATSAACQAIWLQELLSEVTGEGSKKVVLRVDNKSAIALTKNPVFHGRSKHILSRYHFIRECVEKEQIEVEYVPGTEQKADILTKALARVKFKEMKTLLGMQEIHVGIKGENVG